MISDNQDLYQTIQVISNQLRDAGEVAWSAALNDALSISSVSGEILGETRFQLQHLRASQIPLRLGLAWQIDEALAYLDNILGPYEL